VGETHLSLVDDRAMDILPSIRYEVRGRKLLSFVEAVRYAESFAVVPMIHEATLDEDGQGWSWTAFYEPDGDGGYQQVPQEFN
jgi:hypothetical protein